MSFPSSLGLICRERRKAMITDGLRHMRTRLKENLPTADTPQTPLFNGPYNWLKRRLDMKIQLQLYSNKDMNAEDGTSWNIND